MPSIVRWLKIAPVIVASARKAPSQAVRGMISKIAAISSTIPEPIRPAASKFSPSSVENMYFDSSAPVNLKKSV